MTTQVGINGFGRIGRQTLKAIHERHGDKLQVVAINDLFPTETNAHLFKYDSNYGKYEGTVEVKGDDLVVDGETIKVFAERDPGNLPWADLGVDIVIESTGVFRDATSDPGAGTHISKGGANILAANTETDKDKIVTSYFTLAVENIEQLDQVLSSLRNLKQVQEVQRLG